MKSKRKSVIGSGLAKTKLCGSYNKAAALTVAERLNTLGCSDCSECCDGRGWDYDDVECETTAVPTEEFARIFEIFGS